LAARRTLTLHPDFARDLHMRVLGAFASLGFDDHSWLSTEDLRWLVTQGQTDIAAATVVVRQFVALRRPASEHPPRGDLSRTEVAVEHLALSRRVSTWPPRLRCMRS